MATITYGMNVISPAFDKIIKEIPTNPSILIIAPPKSGKKTLANYLKTKYFPEIKIFELFEFDENIDNGCHGIYISQELLSNYFMNNMDYIFYSIRDYNKSYKFYEYVINDSDASGASEFACAIAKMCMKNSYSFAGINLNHFHGEGKPAYGLYQDSYLLQTIVDEMPMKPKILIQGPAVCGKTTLAASLKLYLREIKIYDENCVNSWSKEEKCIVICQNTTINNMKKFDYIFYVGNDVRYIKRVHDEIVKFNYTVDRKSFVREILDLYKNQKYAFTGIRVHTMQKNAIRHKDNGDADLMNSIEKFELDHPDLKESDFETVDDEEIPSADLTKTNTDKINKNTPNFDTKQNTEIPSVEKIQQIALEIPSVEKIRQITNAVNTVDMEKYNGFKSSCINLIYERARDGFKFAIYCTYQIKPTGEMCVYTKKLMEELRDSGYIIITESNKEVYLNNKSEFAIVWISS